MGLDLRLTRRLLRWLLLLLLVLVAPDCGGQLNLHLPAEPAYDLWLAPSLSVQSRNGIAEGIVQWTTFTDVQITVHNEDHICIEAGCFAVHQVPLNTLDTFTDTNWVGVTDWGVIILAGDVNWDVTQDTAIHELGHALGLIHHPQPAYAVMNPTYGQGADHVTCDDVEQYYSLRNVPVPTTVTPCLDSTGPLLLDAGFATDGP